MYRRQIWTYKLFQLTGTYSSDLLNAKVKVAILHQSQDWEASDQKLKACHTKIFHIYSL